MERKKHKHLSSVLSGFLLLATTQPLLAVTPDANTALLKENETTFRHFNLQKPKEDTRIVIVIEQKLENFLQLAADQNGYNLHLSGNVEGILRDASLPMNLKKLLPRLSARFDLAWQIDGRELFVSPASNNETRLLTENELGLEKLQRILRQRTSGGETFSVKLKEEDGNIHLEGPSSHLDALLMRIKKFQN